MLLLVELLRSQKSKKINKLYAGKDGIVGILNEELIDTSLEKYSEIKKLMHTPGGHLVHAGISLKISMLIKENTEGLLMYFRRIILVTFSIMEEGTLKIQLTRLLNTL